MGIFSNNNEPKEHRFTIKPTTTDSKSPSASFCNFLAWTVWIAGAILAFIVSIRTVGSGYSQTTEFDFGLFFSTAMPYGVAGGFLVCMAELLTNVQSIATSLKELKMYGFEQAASQEEQPRPAPAAQKAVAAAPKVVAAAPKTVEAAPQAEEAPQPVTPPSDYKDTATYTAQDAFTLVCDQCGMKQSIRRTVCWQCKAKFINPDGSEKE